MFLTFGPSKRLCFKLHILLKKQYQRIVKPDINFSWSNFNDKSFLKKLYIEKAYKYHTK